MLSLSILQLGLGLIPYELSQSFLSKSVPFLSKAKKSTEIIIFARAISVYLLLNNHTSPKLSRDD